MQCMSQIRCTLHISARLFERMSQKAAGSSSSQKGMQQAQGGPIFFKEHLDLRSEGKAFRALLVADIQGVRSVADGILRSMKATGEPTKPTGKESTLRSCPGLRLLAMHPWQRVRYREVDGAVFEGEWAAASDCPRSVATGRRSFSSR